VLTLHVPEFWSCSYLWYSNHEITVWIIRELMKPRGRRQHERHEFEYLTVVLHALHVHFFIFRHFTAVLVLSMTWNDLFYSCMEDESIWWQMFNFVFLPLKRWFKYNSRIIRIYFASIMTLNNWKMIAETRSYIFRCRFRGRRRRPCLRRLTIVFRFSSTLTFDGFKKAK